MQSKTLILALATTATAFDHVAPAQAARRNLDQLQARATSASASGDYLACYSSATSVLAEVPTAPADLSSYAQTATDTITDPCSITVPASLSSQLSSYESAVFSWYSAVSSEFDQIIESCPEMSSATSELNSVTELLCSTRGSGGGAAATTTGGGAAATTGGSGSVNAGPRETGYAGAVMMAAGFAAVAAL